MVLAGKITSMDQIYENGLRIQESEIVKHLLPDIKSQVVHVGIGGSALDPRGPRSRGT